MDAATLTDRYVDAAMRTVPEKQREDLAAELQASIADQVDARIEGGEAPEAAERAVLTDLGDPDKLAAGYTGRILHLIGPRYYLDWWRLLKLLLWTVPACAAFGIALGQLISGAPVGTVIWQALFGAGQTILHVCFWTTLVFVLLERTGHETMDPSTWTPDRLPEPRQSGARITDLVGSLVWLAIIAGAVIWDSILGLTYLDGQWTPFLDPALWPWWIVGLFALLVAVAAVNVAVYRRGAWTYRLATLHGILDLIGAGGALFLLANGRLVNPDVVAAIARTGGADLPHILGALLAVGIAGIALWDAIDAFLRARRAA
ncbi:permease prefix domain 1-containing protein [Microbacterium candidum]|uniref:Permease prefix domain 1-containing protein n=1 Tax=Microbacterium candidum TaxID=3041922 RepID=A0ABT7N4G8_9MICO|nr:permease prefix domain 1-containing protein [Microbacterium sp. ASV49]MDL9981605.1 permease prefix domain 1-containing protein [Microbacterium sp. ASV49]